MADRDAELVAQSLGGDRAAFAELVRTHASWAGAAAAGALGDLVAAREVTAHAFHRAFVSLARLPDRRRFRQWLYTLVQQTALEWLRNHHDADDAPAPPSDAGTEAEPHQRVLAAILTLPAHHREAILLRYIGQCSCDDIARLTELPPADAELRLARAEHALALRLAQGPPR
jgi:RNA polymerase sigma-70 factor (ECF subfamily)